MINFSVSGTSDYHDQNVVLRTIPICQFLKELPSDKMSEWRDNHILTLLYYTTENREEMRDILRAYVEELK